MEFITLAKKNKAKLIRDILPYPLKINKYESGVLVETLRKDWKDIYGPSREFAMHYYSVTASGVARDEDVWHYHPKVQEDRFFVAQGATVMAVADNRSDSKTFGLLNFFYMRADKDPYILLIPKKTLHGFMVVSSIPAVLLNFPTALYDGKDEVRIPHSKAQIKFSDGRTFSWDLVRKEFFESSNE